jgi:hypothetical protein
MGKQCRPVAGHVVVERQAERRALEQALELTFAPLELAQIRAIELKQVERPNERLRFACAATQQVERGDAPGIGSDRLAVDQE